MIKPWLLRFHRWLTLVFALPLAIIVVTGLILSFEPMAQVTAAKPGTLTAERIVELLGRHDPEGKARSLAYRAYEGRLSIGGVRPDDTIDVDVRTGAELTEDGTVSNLFYYSRVLHETLMLELGWLVHVSTMAMILLMIIGVFMGWPRLTNTVSGWHKGMAWFGLPLLVLSPLTGLFLVWGISFTGSPPPAARATPVPMVEAVRKVGAEHDLSGLVWLRGRAGRQLVRIIVDGEYRVFSVSAERVAPTTRNWVRIWHEGNFAGIWSALMNVAISVALVGLMVTGLIIWARRRFRKRRPRPTRTMPQAVTSA